MAFGERKDRPLYIANIHHYSDLEAMGVEHEDPSLSELRVAILTGMANVGPLELLVVLIVALLVFGPKRLPEMGSSLGKGMRDFKAALAGEHDAEEKQAPEAKPQLPDADEQARGIAGSGIGDASTQSRDQVS